MANNRKPDQDAPPVKVLPAARAKGAFSAEAWSVKRSGLASKSAAHKAAIRSQKDIKGGRPTK
jgi:hypothetical protein